MKRFLALSLCALLALGCGVAASAAPTQLTDFDQAYFDDLAAKELELKDKLDACALAGIPADYETVSYSAFKLYRPLFYDAMMVRGDFSPEEACLEQRGRATSSRRTGPSSSRASTYLCR